MIKINSELLKNKRALRGMTQEELARESGVTSRTIINLESGQGANFKTVAAVAIVLKCSLSELVIKENSEAN